MAREKFKTLTEQMFYILICLKDEHSGNEMFEMIPKITKGRVNIGAGTLYNLLEKFLEEGMISETKVEGRKRSYILTPKGRKMLDDEYQRIFAQAVDYRIIFGGC